MGHCPNEWLFKYPGSELNYSPEHIVSYQNYFSEAQWLSLHERAVAHYDKKCEILNLLRSLDPRLQLENSRRERELLVNIIGGGEHDLESLIRIVRDLRSLGTRSYWFQILNRIFLNRF